VSDNAAPDLAALATAVGHDFSDLALLQRAMAHRSWCAETPGELSNERLEFLGDAVLELVITHYIYEEYPDATEGEMTLLRAAVVSEPALGLIAEAWGVGDLMLLGRGEDLSGGRDKHSILSDVVESLLATVFLDAGFDRVEQIVREHWAAMIDERAIAPGHRDYKTRLQELLVASGRSVAYDVSDEGPQHAKRFTATVHASGEALATGEGTSKKRAEQEAARNALHALEA
jgi:ribonuclease-3